MKKFIINLLILCFCSYSYSQDLTDAANLTRFAEANARLSKSVVFIGNSITEVWVKASPDFFTTNNYIGRGISGQTSPQLLLRFRQDVVNLHPYAVVINIGTNDIAQNTGLYSPQLTMDCIQSMTELARYNGIKVILSSVMPVGEYPWRKEIIEVPLKIDALNFKIKAYAKANNLTYIDYNSIMRNEKGAMKVNYSRDGVHPTLEGYKVMEKIAKENIDKAIEF